jgi:hypothetical protein
MSRFRMIADEAREVSMLPSGSRLLQPDEVFDVPDVHAESYSCQPGLYEEIETAKAPAKAKTKDGE